MLDLIRRFSSRIEYNYQRHGLSGLFLTVKQIRWFILKHTTDRIARWGSQNVYDREWDVLILLDCCRTDMLAEVSDEYDFIGEVGEHRSVGTTSAEWFEYTFTEEHEDVISNTLHITGNTSSDKYVEDGEFLHLEEVWRDGWNKEYKTILPETVTDRAITLYKELDPERTIIHYMQPHTPFVPFPDVNSLQVSGPGIGGAYGKGIEQLAEEYSRDELWEFHIENLRYVLNSVGVLLSNIDAGRVVISADHGQALGERNWLQLKEWGHHRGSTLDPLRKVPYCITSATNSEEYRPRFNIEEDKQEDDPELSVEQKLRYLGYK